MSSFRLVRTDDGQFAIIRDDPVYDMHDQLKIELHALCTKIVQLVGVNTLVIWLDNLRKSFCIDNVGSFLVESSEHSSAIKLLQDNNDRESNVPCRNEYLRCDDMHVTVARGEFNSVYETEEIVIKHEDNVNQADSVLQTDDVLRTVDLTETVSATIARDEELVNGLQDKRHDLKVGLDYYIINTIDECCHEVDTNTDIVNSIVEVVDDYVHVVDKQLKVDNKSIQSESFLRNDSKLICTSDRDILEAVKEETGSSRSVDNSVLKSNGSDINLHAVGSSNAVGSCAMGNSKSRDNGLVEKNFDCHVCFKTFARKYHVKRHIETVHSNSPILKPFVCCVCGKRYAIRDNWFAHEQQHNGVYPYECKKCGKSFNGLGNLKRHESIHNNNRRIYMCPHCLKQYYDKSNLDSHIRNIHTRSINECQYICSYCGKNKWTSLRLLRQHEQCCRGERPFVCGICSKRFTGATALRQHKLRHTGERPFACKICAKRFVTSSSLKLHVRQLHSDERPFKCVVCEMSFALKNVLKNHMLVHTGVKAFECTHCNKSFSTAYTLKLHIKRHLKSDTSAVCNTSELNGSETKNAGGNVTLRRSGTGASCT